MPKTARYILFLLFCLIIPTLLSADDFKVDGHRFLVNGKPFVVKAAEIHYPRIPRPYWEHRMQLCKSLGVNTLCVPLFWNLHEEREDEYDFTDNKDLSEFCHLAKQNGLYVILRPGPFVDADWDNDGLPWWLAEKPGIRYSEQDPLIRERYRMFRHQVDRRLDSLTIEHGGTVITDEQAYQNLTEVRCGIPDRWGAERETRSAEVVAEEIDSLLSEGASISLRVCHGGTTFGHWGGAVADDEGYAPVVTSYDSGAPINEQGAQTPKFYKIREVMRKYSEYQLPKRPQIPNYMISIPSIELKEHADILLGADSLVMDSPLRSLESFGHGWGSMLYITSLPEITQETILRLHDCHDYAQVFVDTVYIGRIDRTRGEDGVRLPAVRKGQELKIFIEATGRLRPSATADLKGIARSVTISAEEDGNELTWTLRRWTIFTIPDGYETAVKALDIAKRDSLTDFTFKGVGYYRGHFKLAKVGDTFLNMEAFGKGQVYVNGHPIGRFWSAGPQQRLYLPGCWLKEGENEIVVLDIVGPSLEAYATSIMKSINKARRSKRYRKRLEQSPSAFQPYPSLTGQNAP